MSQRVLIRLFADGGSQWLSLDAAGRPNGPPMFGLPGRAAEEVSLLLPAEQVLLLETPRLPGRAGQWARALPYAIEERLAAPVEGQHIVFEVTPGQPRLAVAAVARPTLEAALKMLSDAGLQADRARSVAQCLPWQAGTVSLLLEPDAALLRWSASGALACRREQLDEALNLLGEAGVEVASLRVWRVGEAVDWPADARVEETVLDSALPWLAAQSASGPELLQGTYRARRRSHRMAGRWRLAAALAAAAILAGFAHLGIERLALERHVEARRIDMEALLREAVPGTQRVVDPVAQLAAELDRRGGHVASGALPLLGRIAPLVAGSGRYSIEGLDYRAGALELTVRADDVTTLDSLRASLAALPAVQVELTSALPGSKGYEGRLRIREMAG
ncbi:MAG: type II secretion system protein GspL [Lysobacteraceae bacterium]